MLMGFSLSLAVSAASTEVSIVFYDVMTKEAITDLEGVGSTYAKISFTSPEKANAFIICATYDGDDKLLTTHICETISTASEYTTENIDLTGARKIKLFVFDSKENLMPLCAQTVLTRTTDDGSVALAFDDKSLVTAGAYDPDVYVEADVQGAYDDTVASVTSGISGVKYVNNNKPISSTDVYSNRDFVYTTVDLSDNLPAKKVVVNFKAAVKAPSGYIYVNQVDGYPGVGETMDAGTRLSSAKMSGSYDEVVYKEYACDVTEAYNKAIGSKLYLKIYGWYGNTARYNNIIRLNTTSLALSVTPATGDDFKVTFNEGAEEIPVGVYEEITLPECTNVIAGRKFAGWSDGKTVYQAGDKYIVRSSVAFTATYEKDPTTYTAAQKALDGKKVMFIGNSYVYYGNCVLQHTQLQYQWDYRKNDKGYFYQLCKENNIDVTVRNWCFSGHDLNQTFQGACTSSYASCAGVDHEAHMEDRVLDYVIISPHASESEENNIAANFEYVMSFFREANPDVKFVCLGNHAVHGLTNRSDSYRQGIIDYYDTLEEMGVIIADWGEIVNDIANGTVAVPGATQTYNKNTFVNTVDGYHENELSGYITALSAFCAITDESAVGQPYAFCSDSSLHSYFDLYTRRSNRYTNDSDTNFIEVFESPADMKGLQKLVDRYINPELIVPVTLTLNDCDDSGTTTYEKGDEVVLPTPTKSAKTKEYTFTGWTDGTKTYNAGDKLTLNQNMILTATWTSTPRSEGTINFDDISYIKTGAWQSSTSAYDNLVKSIVSPVSEYQSINVRKPKSSSAYLYRPYVFACIDLTNETPVEKVVLNVTGKPVGTSKIYVRQVDGFPAVGDTHVHSSGTQIASIAYSASQANTEVISSLDITEAFNNAVGSKLYIRIHGWCHSDERHYNYVTLNTSSLNLSFTAAAAE